MVFDLQLSVLVTFQISDFEGNTGNLAYVVGPHLQLGFRSDPEC